MRLENTIFIILRIRNFVYPVSPCNLYNHVILTQEYLEKVVCSDEIFQDKCEKRLVTWISLNPRILVFVVHIFLIFNLKFLLNLIGFKFLKKILI